MRDTRKIICLSIAILLLSQIFMIVLVSDSFEKIHVTSELTKYSVPQKDFKRKVEAGLRFGKPLNQLYGMERLLHECADQYDILSNIKIYSGDRELLYSLHPFDEDPGFSAQFHGKKIAMADQLMAVVESENAYLIMLPLLGPGEKLAGHAIFSLQKHEIRFGVRAFWLKSVVLGALIFVFASFLLFIFLFRGKDADLSTQRRYIFVRVLGITILAQVAFAGINAYQFHQDHVIGVKEKVHAQLALLRFEMEQVFARGIGLDRISRVDEFLMEILDVNPEVSSLSIVDNSGRVKARALKDPDVDPGSGLSGEDSSENLLVAIPLGSGDGKTFSGEIRADLDGTALRGMMWKLLLDSLTVALIASLFIIEQINFFVSRLGRRKSKAPARSEPLKIMDKLMLGRFMAFILLFAFALPISFVPLQMRELYSPLWGLPPNMVLGLPISLEMLCALVSSLLAGTLADKKDWRAPFLAGVVIMAVGMLFSALATTGVQFILARGFCGLGYGFSWMALQSFIFSYSTPNTRAQGISNLVAGIFSGHICGTAMGAIVAERLGYSPVFVLGFFITLFSLAFFFMFMRNLSGSSIGKAPIAVVKPGRVTRYLLDRNAALLMICCVIPFSICQVGLLFFATPLYLNQLGVSQSDIGRVLMIYGLSVVYLAPQLSKIVDRHENKKPFIVAGGLLGGLGLSLVFVSPGYFTVITAIFLLGLASSIGSSAQTAFALKLEATQSLGQSKAMSIQRAADKLGQMLGPLVLGGIMVSASITNGLVFLGLGYMAVSLLFFFLAREVAFHPAKLQAADRS